MFTPRHSLKALVGSGITVTMLLGTGLAASPVHAAKATSTTTTSTTAAPTTTAPTTTTTTAKVTTTTAKATTTTAAPVTSTTAAATTTTRKSGKNTTTTAPSAKMAVAPTIAPSTDVSAYAGDPGSMRRVNTMIGADTLWRQGFVGQGVDIAVIDTGVAQVPGLAGKVINGPDLSLDSPYAPVLGVDAFGHGTHMAGIAAGLDAGTTDLFDPTKFVGVAPGSRIVNVKVGAFDGSVDVSQVIAAINWVVQHKNDSGLNIRVINLSFGTESLNNSWDDPLSWAAEVAARNGIVVVSSGGNDGATVKVLSPAYNGFVLAVGSVDQTISPLSASAFSNASGYTKPDVWAPGKSILGLRVANSFLDARFPSARVGDRLFKGSGTSQASAVVSGAAALLASAHPGATAMQIRTALKMSGESVTGEITSFINVAKADQLLTYGKIQHIELPFIGTPGRGSLEATRGASARLVFNGVPLTGERDIFGRAWNAETMAVSTQKLTSWTGGSFNGNSWAGNSWAGASWAGASWAGNSWAGNSWAGSGWKGVVWG